MDKEEFLKKVHENDRKQGHFELTWEALERRREHLENYSDLRIRFYEWLLSIGETVYVYEDVFDKPGRWHLYMHFVIPRRHIVIRERYGSPFEDTMIFMGTICSNRKNFHVMLLHENEDFDKAKLRYLQLAQKSNTERRKGFAGRIYKYAGKGQGDE